MLKDAYMITIYVTKKTQNRPSRYGNGWQHVTEKRRGV